MDTNQNYNLYKDIQTRTDHAIFLGVVGPVRTGKSTFIKRFMDILVLPFMNNEHEKNRAIDELPQSGAGKTITTTEPKFVPSEAVEIKLADDTKVKVRLVDCVGFMIPGAAGVLEDDTERLVKTPWFDTEIPFTKAAEIGTEKVIRDHSTIGVAVFTDGSFGEFNRSDYAEAEERTIRELQEIRKPFVIILNSAKPYSDDTKILAKQLSEKYHVAVIPMNCEQMKQNDMIQMLQEALYEFPITQIEFYLPKWIEMLSNDHEIKKSIIEQVRGLFKNMHSMRDFMNQELEMQSPYIEHVGISDISLSTGIIQIELQLKEQYYYEMLSDILQQKVENEAQMLQLLKEYSETKNKYLKVQDALNMVTQKGYGVVAPEKTQIKLEDPEIIKQGNKYGVKIRALCPSIHMIQAEIETEIAPIVGTKEQADDLIMFIQDSKDGIWDTNIFGKTVEQLVQDGVNSKIAMLSDECQVKLQESMERIVNENNGRMICIIL